MAEQVRWSGRRVEWWLPTVYAVFSGLWIYFSDAVAASTSLTIEGQRVISTYKGFGYVLIVTVLLHVGIRAALRRERTEAKKVMEAEKFKEQVIQGVQEGVIVYGPDLRYQVWNPFMEKQSGVSAGEVLGRHPLEVFPFLQESGVMDHLNRVLAGERVDPIEFPFHVHSTGKKGWNIDTSVPFRNAQGDIIGVLATITDITERRQVQDMLTHSHDLMRYIIEHSQGAVAVHDRNMKYIYVSQQYLQDYKVAGQDIIGRHHYEVMPDLSPTSTSFAHQRQLAFPMKGVIRGG
jgi:PAS domain S-box-containing protein